MSFLAISALIQNSLFTFHLSI